MSADPPLVGVRRARAPAKINLGLFLGPVRESDGRHELVSVMQSISLADELTLEAAPPGVERDEVICPGVPGDAQRNLAAVALRAFRAATRWEAPPLRMNIVKRIPVAAGLGGGSADAAAALRLARDASGLGDERLLHALGAELGADVPAQILPGRWLASGAGERLEALPPPHTPFGVVVLALDAPLSTATVYAQADRLGLARPMGELAARREALLRDLGAGAPLPATPQLLHNDLQRAAVSLCPEIARALAQLREVGADVALVSGSGPTALGLFAPEGRGPDGSGPARARAAASRLAAREPAPICAEPLDATIPGAASDLPVRHNPA